MLIVISKSLSTATAIDVAKLLVSGDSAGIFFGSCWFFSQKYFALAQSFP